MDPRLRLSARIVRDGARRAKRKAGAATRYASPITRPLGRSKRNASDFSSPLSLEELNSNRIARPIAHASITRPSGKHSPGARGVDVQQQWTFNKEDVGRQRTPKHKQ